MSDPTLWERAASIFDFHVVDLAGKEIALEKYRGKVTLVTNVAALCGYTAGGYKTYQSLYSKYKDQGFEVLAFPSNEFGAQMGDIPTCALKYHADFTHFSPVTVNGDGASQIFKFLRSKLAVKKIKWNFEKFLCDRDGVPVKHYLSAADPVQLEEDIKKLLAKSSSAKI